jgi:regulator of protease activity HflC (stomatin/prohibitin superfamily)
MKKISFATILVLVVTVLLASCGTRVQPNYAGVLMENYGKDGKADFSLQKGRVSTWQWGTELYQVPLWEQRAGFAEAVTLKATDNTEFFSAPIYSFKIIEKRAIDVVFDNKQLGSGSDFIQQLQDNILETKILDIMKEVSRSYTTDELMANGGSIAFENKVQDLVKTEFDRRGIELISFSAQLNFSKKVTEKIDSRNEVNTNITVLDQKIEEQKKQNELEELVKQQNLIRSAGITPQLLQQQFIEKWDGSTPLYGNLPITLMKKE